MDSFEKRMRYFQENYTNEDFGVFHGELTDEEQKQKRDLITHFIFKGTFGHYEEFVNFESFLMMPNLKLLSFVDRDLTRMEILEFAFLKRRCLSYKK